MGCKQPQQKDNRPPEVKEALNKLENFDFENITCKNIIAVEEYMSNENFFTLDKGKKVLNEGSIIVFKSSLRRWGKILLLHNNKNLQVKIVCYDSECVEGPMSDNFTFFLNESYDLDKLHNTIRERDMVYTSGFSSQRVISFINNSKYYISRKN